MLPVYSPKKLLTISVTYITLHHSDRQRLNRYYKYIATCQLVTVQTFPTFGVNFFIINNIYYVLNLDDLSAKNYQHKYYINIYI